MVKEDIARDELTAEITENTRDTFRLTKLKNELAERPMYIHTREIYTQELQTKIDENWQNNNALINAYADNEESLAR